MYVHYRMAVIAIINCPPCFPQTWVTIMDNNHKLFVIIVICDPHLWETGWRTKSMEQPRNLSMKVYVTQVHHGPKYLIKLEGSTMESQQSCILGWQLFASPKCELDAGVVKGRQNFKCLALFVSTKFRIFGPVPSNNSTHKNRYLKVLNICTWWPSSHTQLNH